MKSLYNNNIQGHLPMIIYNIQLEKKISSLQGLYLM